MKPSESKALLSNCIKRGYILINNTYYPPNSPQALQSVILTNKRAASKQKCSKGLKSANTDDCRNIRNKAKYTDLFIRLIEIELKTTCWPEYYFSTERNYRLDYALPEYKIGIEVQGGLYMKVSGHKSAAGRLRDMTKNNLLTSLGWKLIEVEPKELKDQPGKVIDMIKQLIK